MTLRKMYYTMKRKLVPAPKKNHVNAVVRVYIDGTLKGTFTPGANLPDVAVKPSLHYLAGSVGAKTALVSRLKVVQIGR